MLLVDKLFPGDPRPAQPGEVITTVGGARVKQEIRLIAIQFAKSRRVTINGNSNIDDYADAMDPNNGEINQLLDLLEGIAREAKINFRSYVSGSVATPTPASPVRRNAIRDVFTLLGGGNFRFTDDFLQDLKSAQNALIIMFVGNSRAGKSEQINHLLSRQ
jgi:hypothetical protein